MTEVITSDLADVFGQPSRMASSYIKGQRTEVSSWQRRAFYKACRHAAHNLLSSVLCPLSSVLCLLPSVLCLLPSAFAAPPSGVQATYDAHKDFLRVEINETYARNQEHYTLSSVTLPVGLLAALKAEKILIDSSGLVGKHGLQPLRYSQRRELDGDKNKLAEFDWDNRRITMIHQGQRHEVALPDNTQDRLSAMYQFMFLSLQDANELDFPMTDGNKLDNYHYSITHNQTIKVPAGEFKTIYLDSQARPGETRTEIWLATQYHNLPCKMIITEANGNVFTQVLSKFYIRP